MIAWTWLRQATAAARALGARGDGGAGDAASQFYRGKLHTAAFFFEH